MIISNQSVFAASDWLNPPYSDTYKLQHAVGTELIQHEQQEKK